MCNARFGLFSYCGRETGYEALFMLEVSETTGTRLLFKSDVQRMIVLMSFELGNPPNFQQRQVLDCDACHVSWVAITLRISLNFIEFPGVGDQRVLCFVCCGCRVGRGCFLPMSSKQEPAAAAEEC